jgi:GNAT superfamily N-acetyltransferase
MARTHKSIGIRCAKIQTEGGGLMALGYDFSKTGLAFLEVRDRRWRRLFDETLNLVHYSRSCQRVGRCMRLAIIEDGEWVGGIVLGSTFPNILVRDERVGLRKFVTDYKRRGLSSPWTRENKSYWRNLQKVVNHARTFVFPQFQGRGVGIRAHRLLLTAGVKMWEQKYGDQVYALDTLCTAGESKLFLVNGWTRAGLTKGYTLDRSRVFSKTMKVVDSRKKGIKNNGALRKGEQNIQWWVWTIQFKRF